MLIFVETQSSQSWTAMFWTARPHQELSELLTEMICSTQVVETTHNRVF